MADRRRTRSEQFADQGSPRIDQLAFSVFLARGDLDRHLRRMRIRYRRRRDAIVGTLTAELPEARVGGIAAGLHVTVSLPLDHDEQAIRTEAELRGVEMGVLSDYRPMGAFPPTLILGYPYLTERAIVSGVREVAAAVRATRH